MSFTVHRLKPSSGSFADLGDTPHVVDGVFEVPLRESGRHPLGDCLRRPKVLPVPERALASEVLDLMPQSANESHFLLGLERVVAESEFLGCTLLVPPYV